MDGYLNSINSVRDNWKREANDEYSQRINMQKVLNFARNDQGFLSKEAKESFAKIIDNQKLLLSVMNNLVTVNIFQDLGFRNRKL